VVADEKILLRAKNFRRGQNIDVIARPAMATDGKAGQGGRPGLPQDRADELYSDSVWFWRISEGVPNTKMKAWKSKLPEETVEGMA